MSIKNERRFDRQCLVPGNARPAPNRRACFRFLQTAKAVGCDGSASLLGHFPPKTGRRPPDTPEPAQGPPLRREGSERARRPPCWNKALQRDEPARCVHCPVRLSLRRRTILLCCNRERQSVEAVRDAWQFHLLPKIGKPALEDKAESIRQICCAYPRGFNRFVASRQPIPAGSSGKRFPREVVRKGELLENQRVLAGMVDPFAFRISREPSRQAARYSDDSKYPASPDRGFSRGRR